MKGKGFDWYRCGQVYFNSVYAMKEYNNEIQ